jgi:glutamyl-tRNA reductase
VGVNHWDATIEIREQFSLSKGQKEALLKGAKREGIGSLFVISTCNRTEIVARNTAPQELIRLLITYSNATLDTFHTYGFEKEGQHAVEHLFNVAAGLDSQILGDLQIVHQVKEGYEFAADIDAVDSELHRLMQHVFRAHKRSRRETALGDGAATTAYAAVRFARKTFEDISDKKILLIGTGKIGKVTCKNLVSLGAKKVTLMNRTPGSAEFMAGRFQLETTTIDEMPGQIADSDLIIVATGAAKPIISINEMRVAIKSGRYKVILDLSVPRNVDPKVGQLDFVKLANMDYLSDVTDKAYQKREKNIPLVKKIIDDELTDYKTWLRTQKVVPTIKALTRKFEDIREEEFAFFEHKIKQADREKVEYLTHRIVNKIAAYSIEHLRDHHESEQITRMVNEMFELETHARDE